MTIDLNADSSVDSINRLVTTFHDIPDAPFSSFDLKIARMINLLRYVLISTFEGAFCNSKLHLNRLLSALGG